MCADGIAVYLFSFRYVKVIAYVAMLSLS